MQAALPAAKINGHGPGMGENVDDVDNIFWVKMSIVVKTSNMGMSHMSMVPQVSDILEECCSCCL